ncbi:MAG: M1 family metallopeptidase [Calditrichaeota bacterium]|nr:M1 family metallopeptidase [Calditrichota bacterium]
MKKILKWTGIIIGSILLLGILLLAGLYWYYGGFGSEYPSGGKLSSLEAQYNVSFYDINLEIDPQSKSIAGYTEIKITTCSDLDTIEFDLIDNYSISKIMVNSIHTKYLHENHKLFIFPESKLPLNQIVDVSIHYSGEPPEAKRPPWQGGFNWSKDENGNPWVGVSCQGEGAKIWFPCKDHPSDEPDSAAINITVADTLFVAANGLLKNVTIPKNNYKTYHWFTGYPINNYLINFGIGKYEPVEKIYIAENGTHTPAVFYVLPQMRDGAEALLDQALDMLYVYRKYFGEYPWIKEKFGLLNTDYYGMEHQTLIAYGNKYKNFKLGEHQFDKLLLHEMGHEWWGNKVTAGNWSDFWIHEGICTYGEALYALDKYGEQAYHDYISYFRKRIFNFSPIAFNGDPTTDDAYNNDLYTKGACFIHTLRYVLGDSIFFKTLKQFATDSVYTFQNTVVTQDLINLVNRNAGNDYTKLFQLYLYTNDYPIVQIDSITANQFNISIPNIDFELPMDVSYADTTQRLLLGKNPISLQTPFRPQVDRQNWYLKEPDED